MSSYVFVIDTDEYSGNFERELGAFCTGILGESGVGEENAVLFHRDCPHMVELMERLITADYDPEDDNALPYRIWPTPGFWNDGMGSEWPDSAWGSPEAIEQYRKSIRDYQERPGGLLEINAETVLPGRHPSYQSVAIFFSTRPTDDVLQFLVARARAYKPLSKFDSEFKILGFRLLETVTESREVWRAD